MLHRISYLLIALLIGVDLYAGSWDGLVINEIMPANVSTNMDMDYVSFSGWIELYNAGDNPIDLTGCYLTDNLTDPTRWKIPNLRNRTSGGIILNPKQFLVIWTDERNKDLHANFELTRKWGEIGLFSPDGAMVDCVLYSEILPDVSWGRIPDHLSQWAYFSEPTPNNPNDAESVLEPTVSKLPTFSLAAGFYTEKQTIELSSSSASAIILYTTDGSIPNTLSLEYFQPLPIDRTTVVRARTFEKGCLPSPVNTQTYFVNERFTLPVVSLSTNPDYLWDDWIGIYANGKNGISGNCLSSPYNFNQDWERPVHVELFENSGALGFQMDGGIKITGSCSRSYPQKSLAIFARTKYGENEIPYPLFPDKPNKKYKDFILRNGGNDWIRTLFSDAMMQYLVKDQMDIDYQAYRPSIIFLNGEYRGILNLREKLNEHYLKDNHGVDPDRVDIIEVSAQEGGQVVVAGDDTHFQTLLSYIRNNDMNSDSAYATIQQSVDTNEFMNYLIAKIYYSSMDWPNNNVKFWRPKTENGRWRWMLFDNESGFGIWWPVSDTTLDNFVRGGSSLALVFNAMMRNPACKNEFIQRFAAHINSTFNPDRVEKHIDRMQAVLEPEMPRQIERWGKSGASGWGYSIYRSMSDWKNQINLMRDFAVQRPSIMRRQITGVYRLSGTYLLTLKTESASAGRIYVNTVKMSEGQTIGEYYKNIPISLNAVANAGYRFVGWQGASLIDSASNPLTLTLSDAATLTALFEENNAPQVAINEIHYHPSSAQGNEDRYEFIELANTGDAAADLSGYSISGAVQFTFPADTQLNAHGYLVLAKDSNTYEGKGYPVYSWSRGSLANEGETIQINDANGNPVDFVSYDDQPPWPSESDGAGPSLALKEPGLDNSLPLNWQPSEEPGGTPGRVNFSQTGVSGWRMHDSTQ